MAYVITDPCKGVCDTACVDVCPVDCIHPTKAEWTEEYKKSLEGKQLYIDPSTCIDCAACMSVCPVSAIYEEHDVPENYKHQIANNANYFKK